MIREDEPIMISLREVEVNKRECPAPSDVGALLSRDGNATLLKWYISGVDSDNYYVEAMFADEKFAEVPRCDNGCFANEKFVVANIIPTGIGCSIGRYAGDGAPVNALIAAVSDYVLCHPNVVNASDFINLPSNGIYTEGAILDRFLSGLSNLHVPYKNRIGVIIDQCTRIEEQRIYNVINAVRSIYGVDVVRVITLQHPLLAEHKKSSSGVVVGALRDHTSLLSACGDLLDSGATAIAITSHISNVSPEDYIQHFSGAAPNPVGGVEAMISHLVARKFCLPVAHAPINNDRGIENLNPIVDPRAAGEHISMTGLACVLIGLHHAPRPNPRPHYGIKLTIYTEELSAVVCPATALGGCGILNAQKRGIPIITVEENETICRIRAADLALDQVYPCENYLEAVGMLSAIRAGISLESLRRPISKLTAFTAGE
jgi:hypothetical protein